MLAKTVSHYILESKTTVGEYELHELLGSGPTGGLYSGISTRDRHRVAIKVISKEIINNDKILRRVQREVDSMSSIRHKNVVELYDFFSDDDNYYMVMEYCRGGNLYDYIVKKRRLKEKDAAYLYYQILNAVEYCHQLGVAHRDLKLTNIMLNPYPCIKITDFGICGFASNKFDNYTFRGSPCYSAPEQFTGLPYDGAKSDLWSLGVILYEMVTGEHPWNTENIITTLHQIKHSEFNVPSYVSEPCADIICGMIKKNPKNRMTIAEALQSPWMHLLSLRNKANMIKYDSVLPPIGRLNERREHLLPRNKDEEEDEIERVVISPFRQPAEILIPRPRSVVRVKSTKRFGFATGRGKQIARRQSMLAPKRMPMYGSNED